MEKMSRLNISVTEAQRAQQNIVINEAREIARG